MKITALQAAALAGTLVLGALLGWSARGTRSYAPSAATDPMRVDTAHVSSSAKTPGGKGAGTGPGGEERVATPLTPAVRAMQIAARLPDEVDCLFQTAIAVGQLNLEDIPDALACAKAEFGQKREMLQVAVLARWSQLDPEAAAHWLMRRPAGTGRDRALVEPIAAQWVRRDPAAARAWVEQLPESDRANAWGGYFAGLGVTAPEKGLAEVLAQPPEAQAQYASRLYQAWAAVSPEAAFRHASSDPSTDPAATLREVILKKWAERSPEEALAAAVGVYTQQGKPATGAATEILAMWAPNNPDAALSYLLKLPDPFRDVASQQTFRAAFEANPEVASLYLSRMPPGLGADGARVSAVAYLAPQDPEKAAALCAELPEGPLRDEALTTLTRGWTEQDAPVAAAWVRALPDEEERSRAMRPLLERWAVKDPVAAGQFLQELEPGPPYDAAVYAYSSKIYDSDPQAAVEWAASIGNPELRDTKVREEAAKWLTRDAAGAKAWLGSTGIIAPAMRNELLSAAK